MALPLAAIMAEMNQPMPQGRPGTVAPTDVLGAYNLAEQAQLANFNAANQRWMGTWGGLAGLGGAGIIAAPKLWDLYKGANAAGAAVNPATSSVPGTAFSAAPAFGANSIPYTAGSDMFGAAAPGAAYAGGAFDTAAAGTGLADAGGTVAADLGAESALGAAAPAIASGFSFADMLALLPFLA